MKARLWIKAILDARPTHKWELTIKQDGTTSSLQQCELYRQAIPVIIRNIRKELGPLEYLYTYELHKKRGAHIHGLHRGPFIPQHWLSELAVLAGLGPIVWIREIDGTAKDIAHQVKYLFKAHRDHNAGRIPRNPVNKSRSFLPKTLAEYAKSNNGSYEHVDTWAEPIHEVLLRNMTYPGRTSAVIPSQHASKVWLDQIVIQERGWTMHVPPTEVSDTGALLHYASERRPVAQPGWADRDLESGMAPVAAEPVPALAGPRAMGAPFILDQVPRVSAALTALRVSDRTKDARQEGGVR